MCSRLTSEHLAERAPAESSAQLFMFLDVLSAHFAPRQVNVARFEEVFSGDVTLREPSQCNDDCCDAGERWAHATEPQTEEVLS